MPNSFSSFILKPQKAKGSETSRSLTPFNCQALAAWQRDRNALRNPSACLGGQLMIIAEIDYHVNPARN